MVLRNRLAAGRCSGWREPLQHRRDAGPQGKSGNDAGAAAPGDACDDGGLTISTPTTPSVTARFCEDALRAAGVPKALARRVIASGWKSAAGQDDADAAAAEVAAALVKTIDAATERLKATYRHGPY
jgi:hypothetical protein